MQKYSILLVAPSAEILSGSLLRPINILHSLRTIKNIHIKQAPVKSVNQLIFYIRDIISSKFVIISGVNPWTAAIIVFLRRLIRKPTIIDVHGFAWYEASFSKSASNLQKLILLVSENLSYRNASHLIVASQWLARKLKEYFNIQETYVIENTVTRIFEEIVHKFNFLSFDELCNLVSSKELRSKLKNAKLNGKYILLAPLPKVFSSNMLAHDMLLKLAESSFKDNLIIITGFEQKRNTLENTIYAGYLNYIEYVAILLLADAVVLPFPKNAICGGIRNKLLEAGYCGKLVISTSVGMMHMPVRPFEHYIPIRQKIFINEILSHEVALKLNSLVKSFYSFEKFKEQFIKFFIMLSQNKV